MNEFDQFVAAVQGYGQVVQKIPETLGPFVVGAVQDNITNLSEPANAPLTKQIKGDKGPLKDSGELRASITYVVNNGTLIVGTNKAHAPLVHYGGIVRPRSAKKLTIPTTREIKRWSDTKGVKGFIAMLEAKGWKLKWNAKSLIGTPPKGAKGMGIKLKRKDRKTQQSYLLFIRKESVKVPGREFMFLTRDQLKEMRHMARRMVQEAHF